jgi:hypothetical protein
MPHLFYLKDNPFLDTLMSLREIINKVEGKFQETLKTLLSLIIELTVLYLY